MNFFEFNVLLQKHLATMFVYSKNLFVVNVDKDKMWNLYLDSFPKGTNEIFRKRREFDCSCCKSFIRQFGNVVAIKNNKLVSIWDFETNDSTYQPVINELSKFIHNNIIEDVFISKQQNFGTEKSREMKDDKIIVWNHFFVTLPKEYVFKGSDSVESEMAKYRDVKNVFKRSVEEISIDSVETILELISQNSLYKGEEWKSVLEKFLSIQKEYKNISDENKENYCWTKSIEVGPVIGKIKNHSIGTLLVDITLGVDLNDAVKKYECIVAPINYKRPKAIFSKKMLDDARKTVEELGLINSLKRRFATIDDITANNILFANKNISRLNNDSVFDKMSKEISTNVKNFDKIEEIQIDNFIKNILPNTRSIQVLLENNHISNMVSLIAPCDKNAPSMFKWNSYSWAYNGNITDSMKERVKSFGGKVDGVLRCSIMWNEKNDNNNDFDLHCIEPNRNEIYFGNRMPFIHASSGRLDVDIRRPFTETRDGIAVENITWSHKNKMPIGEYKFFVYNYSHNGGRSGFTAEIEFDGQIYSFNYDKELRQGQTVEIAKVILSKDEVFSINESIPSSVSSREIWGLKTNQFHDVSVLMNSPNYWDELTGNGNKHYFFMLDKCINNTRPNGFFNEFLKEDLLKHKRVFEALGSEMRVEDSNEQLSGVGFSSTQRNSIFCKIEGNFSRMLKINF